MIRHLYQQLPISQVGSAGVVLAIMTGLWNELPARFLTVWLTLHVVVTLGRLGLLLAFRMQEEPIAVEDMPVWAHRFTLGALQAGMIWGWAAYQMMTLGSITTQTMMLFALGGILAGASQSVASWMRSYFAFCLPLLLPSMFWLALQPRGEFKVMSFLVLFFLMASLAMARIFNRALAESFALRYENLELIDNLNVQIQTRERSESSLRAHNVVLELLATHNSAKTVLNSVCGMVEEQLPGAVSAILMLDETGERLQVVAAPQLPDTYHQVITGAVVAQDACACAAAVRHNVAMSAENIAVDPLWVSYRDIALAHDLKSCHCVPVRDMDGNAIGVFSIYFKAVHALTGDEAERLQSAANLAGVVVARTRAEEKLHQMAHYDALTELPNRTLFMDRLKQTLAWAKRSKQKFSLLYIDLDKFKVINDTYGHGIGDLVLQEAARRLRSCVRDVDTAARMGGDEFTVLISDIRDNRAPSVVANKLIATLCEPIIIDEHRYKIGASVGISIYPTDARVADKLIGMADSAMYCAKQTGGNVCIYYSSMDGHQARVSS